jgi:hypothetical protein
MAIPVDVADGSTHHQHIVYDYFMIISQIGGIYSDLGNSGFELARTAVKNELWLKRTKEFFERFIKPILTRSEFNSTIKKAMLFINHPKFELSLPATRELMRTVKIRAEGLDAMNETTDACTLILVSVEKHQKYLTKDDVQLFYSFAEKYWRAAIEFPGLRFPAVFRRILLRLFSFHNAGHKFKNSKLENEKREIVQYGISLSVAAAANHYCSCCIEKNASKLCTGCHYNRYCSAECQKNDWPIHKMWCKKI